MSEYQYYEFLAIDGVLSDQDMDDLRGISTRANITPTSFINEYNWGDLKVNPQTLLARYFDIFMYYSSWGVRRVGFRFPRREVDESKLAPFLVSHRVDLIATGDFMILDMASWNEDGQGWDWEFDASMTGLAPARDELMAGDLRPLYLAWLMAAQSEELDEDALEPPIPPGLRSLTSAQELLVDFFHIGEDLLAVAAEASDELAFSPAALAAWIADLPAPEKDRLLFEVATGKHRHVGISLLKQFRELHAGDSASAMRPASRRVRTLLDEALTRSAELERQRQRRAEQERQRREAEVTRQRAAFLAALAEREPAAWDDVERLVSSMKPKAYDEALVLLCDLRDLAEQQDAQVQFAAQIASVQKRHQRKSSFITRLRRAGLAD